MKKWLETVFESSSGETQQFKSFVKAFKKELKTLMGPEYNIQLSSGHFYVSGFIEQNGKYVYFSTSDVRSFRNEWYNHLLVRTAKHDKDYTGGDNNYTTLPNVQKSVERLMSRDGK
jgi:hypothetical protein